MRIKLLIFKPELIEYIVIYKTNKTTKIVHIRTLTFMCINRVAILKEVYVFDYDKYKCTHLERYI